MSCLEHEGGMTFKHFFLWIKQRGLFFLFSVFVNAFLFYTLFYVQFPLQIHEFADNKISIIPIVLAPMVAPRPESTAPRIGIVGPTAPSSTEIQSNITAQKTAPQSSSLPESPAWSGLPSYGSSVGFGLQVPSTGTPDLSLKPLNEQSHFGIKVPGSSLITTNFLQYWQPVVRGDTDGVFSRYRFGSSKGKGVAGQISFPGLKQYNLLPWARRVVAKIIDSWDKILAEKPLAKGFAQIRLTFSRQGRITSKVFVKTAQSAVLKAKILRLIDQGSPFPALPRNYPKKTLEAILRLACK